MRYFAPEIGALDNGVVIVNSGVDPRILHFLFQFPGAMDLMHGVGDRAAHDECEVRVAEVLL